MPIIYIKNITSYMCLICIYTYNYILILKERLLFSTLSDEELYTNLYIKGGTTILHYLMRNCILICMMMKDVITQLYSNLQRYKYLIYYNYRILISIYVIVMGIIKCEKVFARIIQFYSNYLKAGRCNFVILQ